MTLVLFNDYSTGTIGEFPAGLRGDVNFKETTVHMPMLRECCWRPISYSQQHPPQQERERKQPQKQPSPNGYSQQEESS